MSGSNSATGFTLLELLIVVVVISILMGIAVPSYQSFLEKSRRTEAKELLLAAAQRQQQFYTQNDLYTTDASALSVPTSSINGYYTLTIVAGNTGNINTSYSMSATPAGTQADDSACGTFTLNSLGQRTVSGSQTTPPCW